MNEQIKATEAERLIKHIRDNDYVIALAIDGKMLDSVQLSQKIGQLGVEEEFDRVCDRRFSGAWR